MILSDLSGNVRFDLVHQLHGFNDAEDGSGLDHGPDLDERGGIGRRGAVECSDDGRFDLLVLNGGCCRKGRQSR